jgi:translation initiation factor IF-2
VPIQFEATVGADPICTLIVVRGMAAPSDNILVCKQRLVWMQMAGMTADDWERAAPIEATVGADPICTLIVVRGTAAPSDNIIVCKQRLVWMQMAVL